MSGAISRANQVKSTADGYNTEFSALVSKYDELKQIRSNLRS